MTIQSQDTLTIARAYAEKYPESQRLHQEAQALLPGGVTHMARTFDPFPLYVDRCVGAHKWDVDGNRYHAVGSCALGCRRGRTGAGGTRHARWREHAPRN